MILGDTIAKRLARFRFSSTPWVLYRTPLVFPLNKSCHVEKVFTKALNFESRKPLKSIGNHRKTSVGTLCTMDPFKIQYNIIENH